MKIEYSVTAEDIGALYSYLWRNSSYFKRRMAGGTLVVIAWILVSAYLSQGELALRDAFIALNFAIAFPLLTLVFAMLRRKNDKRILSIDSMGIHTQIGKRKGNARWEKIAQVMVANDHVFILGRNLNAFAIPNRAFQGDTQRNEFIQLCDEYLGQLRPRAKGRQLAWWTLGFSVALLAFFSPHFYDLGWHLRHGDGIEYKELHVPVPRGWIARAERPRLMITKLPFTLFAFFRLEWITHWISISKGAPLRDLTIEQANEAFEKTFWTFPPTPTNSAVISGPLKFGGPPNDLFCMIAADAKFKAPVFVECLFHQGIWQANFRGDEKDVESFYEILRGVH